MTLKIGKELTCYIKSFAIKRVLIKEKSTYDKAIVGHGVSVYLQIKYNDFNSDYVRHNAICDKKW